MHAVCMLCMWHYYAMYVYRCVCRQSAWDVLYLHIRYQMASLFKFALAVQTRGGRWFEEKQRAMAVSVCVCRPRVYCGQ